MSPAATVFDTVPVYVRTLRELPGIAEQRSPCLYVRMAFSELHMGVTDHAASARFPCVEPITS